jgi:cyclic di-GMP phosphodiesterase
MSINEAIPHAGSPTKAFAQSPNILRDLLACSIILEEDWESLPSVVRDELCREVAPDKLMDQLVEHHLLTDYQAARVGAGQLSGLILGNYRVLERVGAGGMGVVFKAEHLLMRRLAAIKVLPVPFDQANPLLTRFVSEMRAVAKLQHPNIVAAFEAGKTSGADHDFSNLYYFVMEFVPGMDLEQIVRSHGPMPATKVCDLSYQIASALAEAHGKNLVHRDIKPSNILVTPEGQAKLTDFGLARHFQQRHLTQPGTALGTVDYMAPEQAHDASSVDIRADVYSLGATMYWCLTGQVPFHSSENLVTALVARQNAAPPSPRKLCPEIPPQLDAIVVKSMALRPQDRFADPQTMMASLLNYLKSESLVGLCSANILKAKLECDSSKQKAKTERKAPLVLIVDDDPSIRMMIRLLMEDDGYQCREANDGLFALEALNDQGADLVVMDVDMPNLGGVETLERIRNNPPSPNIKVIMMSGKVSPDQMAQFLTLGADDFITKPPSMVQTRARARAALSLKDAQDRSDRLTTKLYALTAELEQNLTSKVDNLTAVRDDLLMALADLGALRCGQSEGHLVRMQRYCRCLAEEAACLPSFAEQVNGQFLALLQCCAPLHDIGEVALPDYILQKPNKLDQDERMLIHTHANAGAELLERVVQRNPSALVFLHMAIDITRYHHERFDGNGYPDKLGGNAIPLSARLVAIADVYDALRSRRLHRPALSHSVAMDIITTSKGQFDPALLQVFAKCGDRFDGIFREYP